MTPNDNKFLKEPAGSLNFETIKRNPVKNIPSEDDPEADDDVLENALFKHCQTSDEQVTDVSVN